MRTDAELVAAARSDADAFAELYRRHAPSVYSWLRARAGERIAADASRLGELLLGERGFEAAPLKAREFDHVRRSSEPVQW